MTIIWRNWLKITAWSVTEANANVFCAGNRNQIQSYHAANLLTVIVKKNHFFHHWCNFEWSLHEGYKLKITCNAPCSAHPFFKLVSFVYQISL